MKIFSNFIFLSIKDLDLIKKLQLILLRKEKQQLKWLLVTIILMALLEVIGLTSILPFVHLAANPESIYENKWLYKIYTEGGFESYTSMLIFAGVVMLIFLTTANLFTVFTTWLQYKVAWEIAHNISARLLKAYLNRPYAFFLNSNTSELQAKIVMEVGQVCTNILVPLNDLIARSLVVIVIFALLLFVDIKTAFIILVVLGTLYSMIFLLKKGILNRLGVDRVQVNLRRFRSMSDALTGVKTSRIYDAQDFFYERFESASKYYSTIHPRVHLISILPKSLIEIIGFGGIILATIYILTNGGDMKAALPAFSLYVIAGYRLLPSLQRVFSAATKIKHALPVLDTVYDGLNKRKQVVQVDDTMLKPLSRDIKFDHVGFSYKEGSFEIFSDLNLKISKGETIAFVGSTGSGKTTLVDLFVGLLEVTNGSILIDDVPLKITETKKWQAQIGYVQQDVFLFDDTITNNIAIGEPADQIDMNGIIEATKIANIHQHIISLKEGYETFVGERGVRLSGGQQQRIGLARALYKKPRVLVLDEATSALDGLTENKVIESLKKNSADWTIVIIAHRLSTVRHADCIYVLDKGKIVESGSYDTLMNNNAKFKEMVEFS